MFRGSSIAMRSPGARLPHQDPMRSLLSQFSHNLCQADGHVMKYEDVDHDHIRLAGAGFQTLRHP